MPEAVFDLGRGAALTLPDGSGEPCRADDVAGIRVTDACVDPELAVPFIDEDEIREVEDPETGDVLSYRFVHGGFEESPVRFALHFPAEYRGRFFQSTYPTVGSEAVSDDRLAGGLRNGAAVVASNNAGGVAASPALGGVRANAGAAKLARHLIPQLYGSDAPTRGYIYGVSGGAYQTIGALESTSGVWDGGVPIVPGTSNAIPSFMTVQLLGLRALADDLPAIVDAVEPGGSGDPFAGLEPAKRAVLEEVTRLGFPLGGWWQHETLQGGAFGIVQLAVRGIDAGYADDFVRHEAPHVRVEMKGLHLRPVAAGRRSWGQSEPGVAGEGGKQPRQRRDGPALPDGPGPASKTRRCNASEPVAKLLNRRAGSNLVDMGRSAVHDHRGVVVDSEAGRSPRWGGHSECLRRRCGEAAGAQLGTSLVDRRVVNVGTVPVSPFPPPSQGGGGQVRRQLMTLGRGGALVVVRAPESGVHGEGGQRVRSSRIGMPGGRR